MRTIDADELLKSAGIFEAKVTARGCGKSILPLAKTWLWSEVNKAPTIDAVPVVRCAECKHFGFAHECNYHAADENGTPIFVRENDFCSYGEKRCEE